MASIHTMLRTFANVAPKRASELDVNTSEGRIRATYLVLFALAVCGAIPRDAAAATPAGNSSADLAVTLSAFPRPVPFDRPFNLGVFVTYPSGPSTVDALLRVAIPGVSLGAIGAPVGWSCSTVPGGFECRNPAYVSSPYSSNFNVEVTHTRPIGSSIAASAQVSSSVPDPDISNNSAGLSIAVSGAYADLSLDLDGGRGQVRPGNDIAYELFVFNAGPSNASAAFIDVPMPPGTTFVSFTRVFGTIPTWTCSTPAVGAGGNIRCETPVFPRSRGTRFDLVTRASAGTVGSILTATANIGSATPDPDPSDNSASVISLVQSGNEVADLALTVNDSPDPVSPGGNITYTVTLSNQGPDTAVSGGMRPSFSEPGLISITAPAGWNCEVLPPPPVWPPSPPMVFCRARIFPVGTAVFTFVVETDRVSAGPITMSAQVASGTSDPNTANNSATATTRTIFGASVGVPALSPALLALLAVVFAFIGMRAATRRA